MARRTLVAAIAAITLATATGCASTDARPAFDATAQLAEARVGKRARWLSSSEEDEAARKETARLLAGELDADGAVAVALLQNRTLQAEYEELGVAQADLVQAGLLKNPRLSGGWLFPLDPGHVAMIPADFTMSFVELLALSSRKKIATAQLEHERYRVADEVVRHATATKVAYYTYVAAAQTWAMRQVVLEAAQASVELARKQNEAGTRNDLALSNEEALFAQVSLDVVRARGELASAREQLVRRMGLYGPQVAFKVAAKLPEMPAAEPPVDHVETLAVRRRLDVLAARKDVEAVSYAVSLARGMRVLPGLEAGVGFERKPEGIRVLGPTASVELPIFDQGQANVARAEAELRRAEAREASVAIDARSEAREARARLLAARDVVTLYRTKLVPVRERVVALSQQQYDAMLLGVFQLLAAKQAEITAYKELIEALRDYWIARAELERAAGGPLEEKKEAKR